jgi:TATA-box binding protein (TBP) (component of TFIID and TFIIIB)
MWVLSPCRCKTSQLDAGTYAVSFIAKIIVSLHLTALCSNAEYNPQRFSACILRFEVPRCACLVFATGKAVVTGCKNEDDAKAACKRLEVGETSWLSVAV